MSSLPTLTEKQEILIAAYLNGEDVYQALLTECKQNPALLTELAKVVATDRLLANKLNEEDRELFVKEVIARINITPNADISSKVIKSIDNHSQVKSPPPRFWNTFSMAASVVLCTGLVIYYTAFMLNKDIATITKVASVVTNYVDYRVGKTIKKGGIVLSEGYSEIVLTNGVKLVLEAPIDLYIKSENLVVVNKGILVARVPEQAIGFKIDTPSSEIVDLGTEFAVRVDQSGDSQIHVIEGEVKARSNRSQTYKHIKKDQALGFNKQQEMFEITSESAKFMRALPGKSAKAPEFLHWTFNEKINNGFPSMGKGIDDKQYSAMDRNITEGKKITQGNGVFGEAVFFDGNGSWLETEFPGIADDNPRTVAFWLKIPHHFSVNNAYGILSWGLQEDYASWQISPNPEHVDGQIGCIRVGTYNAQVVGSTDLRDDKWHHVAIVMYGGESSNIATHVLLYVDGMLEKTKNKSFAKVLTKLKHPKSKSLSMGRNIGFDEKQIHYLDKYFKGWVDELFVVNAALDQEQVQQIMVNNKIN
ncbi:LamG-like jellyroll fold domain-containing protein [Paraglaciecola sp. L3A3]|uniref:LamG-like jellyroll fold domain-containing protein n=1 Tax=Paraglaciecola sp. L3A3 TaxID=2686358 RepID=UPI00131B5982|nr:LamG-like jellyroll fold domain-containing protein [Paraglaciecola sp. L3A3]